MLVLTRKLDERISIGHDVEVVVLKVLGNRVGLGIMAPAEVPIRRDNIAGSPDEFNGETVEFALGTNPPEAELCRIV